MNATSFSRRCCGVDLRCSHSSVRSTSFLEYSVTGSGDGGWSVRALTRPVYRRFTTVVPVPQDLVTADWMQASVLTHLDKSFRLPGMSKRLQVLLDDSEMRDLRRVARAERMTVAAWVRQTLRAARRHTPAGDAARKLAAIRAGARHEFPTGDIDVVLAEIERGYSGAGTP